MKAIILKNKILCVVLVTCTFLVGAITLINAGSNGNGSTRDAAGTLVSIHTETAPTLDGLATETIWKDATEMTISLVGGTNPGDVKLKSVYTDTYLFIYAEWDDSTLSIIRGAQGEDPELYSGAWKWDDTNGAWEHQIGGSEDRLTFMWDISVTNFDTQGCMVKCHPTYGSAGSFLNIEGEIGDIWHMKAARFLPAISSKQMGTPTITAYEATAGKFEFHGYYDDKHIIYDEAPHTGDGGRHGDEGTSAESHNRNASKSTPKYMEKNPTDWLDAMILYQSEIDAGEIIVTDPLDANYNATDITSAWAKYSALNAIVPERILKPATGSRGDIEQAAIWEDGTWYTEITRKLVTGHDGDIQFDDLSKTYAFGIATMDNTGGGGHNTHGSKIYQLAFDIVSDQLDFFKNYLISYISVE